MISFFLDFHHLSITGMSVGLDFNFLNLSKGKMVEEEEEQEGEREQGMNGSSSSSSLLVNESKMDQED